MKHKFLALFLMSLTFSVNARVTIDTQSFEYMFPRGVSGDDWFSRGAYDGNKLSLVKNGKDLLEERLKLIKSARRSILLSTYIYDTDVTANKVTNALCERARLGVDVRLLVDSMGAKDFYKKESERLRNCGAGIMLFAPGKWDLLRVVKTMHEKLLIIDGEKMMMGGNGVQNSYHHVEPAHKFFHDMDIKIEGPVACWWHFKFIENFKKARTYDRPQAAIGNSIGAKRLDERLYGSRDYPPCYPFNVGESRVYPVYGNPFFHAKKTPIEDTYLKSLEEIEDGATVKLYGPYFVPTQRFVDALLKAKREKNAKISIITNSIESNDEGWAPLVGMVYRVKKLMASGIDIRLYPGPMTLHRKVGIYNSKWSYIGSDNLDSRGQHYNTENIVFTDDKNIVSEMESEFDKDYLTTAPLSHEYLERILAKRTRLQKWFIRKFLKFI